MAGYRESARRRGIDGSRRRVYPRHDVGYRVGAGFALAATLAFWGVAGAARPWFGTEGVAWVLVGVVGTVVALLYACAAFRRTRLTFDPRTRLVEVRIGRFPFSPLRRAIPLDHLDAVVVVDRSPTEYDHTRETYELVFLFHGADPELPLGVVRRDLDAQKRSLDAAVAAWRAA
ncbi:MAG TPA: hypothetical protein RMH99_16020 [Sandaracinaceae bacterium LLY-WYZ-13_1]|nr:hypothetical protein [Sandaracinaceae bacterium LLY-WYZ-13_1]